MDPDYIESLRLAYERFFAAYGAAPVVVIDTNDVDFVRNPDDREAIFSRIRGALGEGPRQPALPGLNGGAAPVATPPDKHPSLEQTPRRLRDFQHFHRQLDHAKQFFTDPYLNFILLQEEIGELARAFAQRWIAANAGYPDRSLPAIREELADVLAYVIKLANYAGIDLEEAYLDKMRTNQERRWRTDKDNTDTEGANA
jgi:NTP pyrophosphatase (non-canonical NTP hydrolase)